MQQPWFWYFGLDLGLWGIALGAMGWAWPRLEMRARLSACLTAVVVMGMQILNEILSLNVFHAWSLSEAHTRLLGIQWLGAPVEEYLFWFAFAWMIPFLYSGFRTRGKATQP